jgi:phosphoglycolate phosphatase-like HAD superfamily hydrolase
MIKKYKHISFDLDGTLIHTLDSYRHTVVQKVVMDLGGKIDHPHSIDRFWFEGGRNQIIKDEFLLDPNLFWEAFRTVDHPTKRIEHTHAYEEAERVIRKLKELGKTVSIVTGAHHGIATMEIAKLNNAPHDFYLSITSGGYKEKPDPASLHFVMNTLLVKPEETLYIGNSIEDAHLAKNAGVDFIHIERNEYQFDLSEHAISTIHTLDDLFIEKP